MVGEQREVWERRDAGVVEDEGADLATEDQALLFVEPGDRWSGSRAGS